MAEIQVTFAGKKYAESPGRYKTRADRYLVARIPFTPGEAIKEYAEDHPDFTGLAVMIGIANTKPAIGIDRKVPKEYLYDVQAGRTTRRTKQA